MAKPTANAPKMFMNADYAVCRPISGLTAFGVQMDTVRIAPLTEETFTIQVQSLGWLVKSHRKGNIQLPDYQRKAVWSPKQKVAWAQSIRRLVAVATFFVYRLPDSDVRWLADGSQRLHATLEIAEKPEEYGMTPDEIERILDDCNISVAFLRCVSHMEGYYHFIHLNRGFAPTPAEVYKGFLVQTETGKWFYEEVQRRVEAAAAIVIRKPTGTSSRAISSKETRDNLALFYQYITKTPQRGFWQVASAAIGEVAYPLEQQIADWLLKQSRTQLEVSIREFTEFIRSATKLISRNLIERKGEDVPLSSSLYRHLLHLCIYCRNISYSAEHRDKIIDYILLCSSNGNARLNMVDTDGRFIQSVNAHLDELSKVEPIVCELLGLPWERRNVPKKATETI